MSQQNKKIILQSPTDHNKIPRIPILPDDNSIPEFRAEEMDIHGEWGWDKLDSSNLQDFLQKILYSQKLTWQALLDHGSHLVEIASIIPEAQKRLCELKKDDLDHLYSLRLTGVKRVWGIKERNILWLLWWDPFHKVCPSPKKNT